MKHLLMAAAVMACSAVCAAQESGSAAESGDSAQVVAIVLEREVPAADKAELSGIILGELLDRYALDAKLEPTDEELDAFAERMVEIREQKLAEERKRRLGLKQELKSDELTEEQRKVKQDELANLESILEFETKRKTSARASYRAIGMMFVTRWKVNKALHEKYGGRVIAQQVGPEPLDAYRKFLEEEQKKGSFKIVAKDCEPLFWDYFTNEKKHVFYSDEKGKKFITTPWWLIEESAEETK